MMPSKARRAGTKKRSSPGEGAEARRLLAKGRLREAAKAARRTYQKQPGPETAHLLGEALLRRIEQLESRGMASTAAPLLEEILALPDRTPEQQRRLAAALARLGMPERAWALAAEAEASEESAGLREALADAAVRDPSTLPENGDGFAEEAETVRRALALVEAGEDTEAGAMLRAIPRRSPFAAWRLFVRGLIAFYGEGAAAAGEAWDRLDATRMPGRLAATLRAAATSDQEASASTATRLERALGEPPVAERLTHMASAVRARDWAALGTEVKQLNNACTGSTWQAWRQRVTAVLYPELLNAAIEEMDWRPRVPGKIERVLKLLQPLAIDPTWDRFRALAFEQVAAHEQALAAWGRYEQAIEQQGLFDEAAELARSLVIGRQAELVMDDAAESGALNGGSGLPFSAGPSDDDGASHEMVELALALARRSVAACPSHVANHQRLANMAQSAGEKTLAAEAHEALLELAPQEQDSRHWLLDHYLRHDNPARALDHARRLGELNPLNASVGRMLYLAHVGTARQQALAGHIDAARQHMQQAEEANPESAEKPPHLIKLALLEETAGEDEAARKWRHASQSAAPDDGAWQMLAYLESRRWKRPARQQEVYLKAWKKALRGRTSADRAAEMAKTMASYLVTSLARELQQEHLAWVADYLRRSASTAKYTREQMREVAFSLHLLLGWAGAKAPDGQLSAKAAEAARRIGDKGSQRFPDLPECHWLLAKAVVFDGNGSAPTFFKVFQCIRRTLELTEGTEDEQLKLIRREAEALQQALPSELDGPAGMLGILAEMLGDKLENEPEKMLEQLVGHAEEDEPWPVEGDDLEPVAEEGDGDLFSDPFSLFSRLGNDEPPAGSESGQACENQQKKPKQARRGRSR